MSAERPGGLLAWQYRHYPEFHGSRKNLAIHIAAVPLFQVGNAVLFSPLAGAPWWLAPIGLATMGIAMAAQGRGHAVEQNPPVPFASPFEAVARIFLEQWINFPRFVLSGGWGRAWKASSG